MKKIGGLVLVAVLCLTPVLGWATEAALVTATGKIVAVDAAAHSLKITHDPIAALDWPAMTMVFNAADGVDLSALQEGARVTFTLRPEGDDYVVTQVGEGR